MKKAGTGGGRIDERERLRLEYEAMWLEPMPVMKPPVPVVVVPLTDADAAVVAANPESVRVSARRDDGVSVLMRPRANPNHVRVMVDHVREVDGDGRPVWPTSDAIHVYDPLDALKR
jgi:hypothetical protein